MDRDTFIACIKTDDTYKVIREDVETRFDTSSYELDKPLTKRNNWKIIGLIKYVLGGKTMTKLVGLKAKTYSYLTHDSSEEKKGKNY